MPMRYFGQIARVVALHAEPRLAKSPHGEPCNHYGQCCTRSLCWTGRLILGSDAKAPCPALIDCGEQMFCRLSLCIDCRPAEPFALCASAISGTSLLAGAL